MDSDDGGPGGNLGVDLGADIDVPWSSILFSLDVAVGLWPLLREGLRSSRLRPGALTRPCAS